MSDQSDDPRDYRWLLEPPGAGEVHLHFSAGAETDISDTARQALETLIAELCERETAEVAGYNDCGQFFDKCNPYSCTLHSCLQVDCNPLVTRPCFIDSDCRIGALGRIF